MTRAAPGGPDAGVPPPPRPPRPAVRFAVTVFRVLAGVAMLGVLELALRVAGVADDVPGPDATAAQRVLDLTDPRLFVSDPDLLWRLRPGETFDLGDPEFPRFSTNDLGLRGPPVPAERAAGDVLVLCLGDSITFGLGLPEGRTLPERIEARLRERPGFRGTAVRVVNAGVPGYSSVQGLRLLRRLRALRPDVVVWCFGMNDSKPALGRPDADLRLPEADTAGFRRALASLRLVRVGMRAAGRGGADRPDAARVDPGQLAAVLRDVRSETLELGAELVIAETPARLETRIREFEAVLAAARAAGAGEVRGSAPLLSPWTPTPLPSDLASRTEAGADGRLRVVFGIDDRWADQVVPVGEVERRLAFVGAWREKLLALEAALPGDRIPREQLLAGVAEREAYTDNCHLTPAGADAVAAVVAERIAAAFARRGR